MTKAQPDSETSIHMLEGVIDEVVDARFGGGDKINAYLVNYGSAENDYPSGIFLSVEKRELTLNAIASFTSASAALVASMVATSF